MESALATIGTKSQNIKDQSDKIQSLDRTIRSLEEEKHILNDQIANKESEISNLKVQLTERIYGTKELDQETKTMIHQLKKKEEYSLHLAQETISSLYVQLQTKESLLRKYQDLIERHGLERDQELLEAQTEIKHLRQEIGRLTEEKLAYLTQ